jgi:hypothetical protein
VAAEGAILVASAGTPAVILRSDDEGHTWRKVRGDSHPAAFIDALRFRDPQHGFAFGDPIEGHFLLWRSTDAGRTWADIPNPIKPIDGEAGFAASNGSLAFFGSRGIAIGLGGRRDGGPSRVLRSGDDGESWQAVAVECMPASASAGIFAIDFRDQVFGIAVGGDYQDPDRATGHMAITEDGGRSWRLPRGRPTAGYRSSVVFAQHPRRDADESQTQTDVDPSDTSPGGVWVATGPQGTDCSLDGDHWVPIAGQGFHALRQLPDGRVIGVGSEGRIAILNIAELIASLATP